jgi:predicted transcriptional regulator
MSIDMVDLMWHLMRDGEFYSPEDLANTLGQPTDTIVRILEFLARYKFIERMTKRELIFRKSPTGPSPNEAVKILRMLRTNVAQWRKSSCQSPQAIAKRINFA